MDQRDSYCPYLLSSELTVKGTGLSVTAGKEDPFELDFSLDLRNSVECVVIGGRDHLISSMKYH